MNILLVHQNFPGQFKNLVAYLAANPAHSVAIVSEKKGPPPQGVRYALYQPPGGGGESTHHYLRDFEGHIRRGQSAFKAMTALRDSGFSPDVIFAHPGWGETLFARDAFPKARILHYMEFFYRARGSDLNFDPEFPTTLDDILRIRIKNSTQVNALLDCDACLSPTVWQRDQYPTDFRSKISVIHDGVDTRVVAPNHKRRLVLPGLKTPLSYGDEIITYISRNLEPYRGFHTFMRALPRLLRLRPNCQVIVVGGDGVSYGRRVKNKTYRQLYTEETGLNSDRVHFMGRVPYQHFLGVLQVSAVHIYLTYPFVLSWSMLEAMGCGCVVLGSRTPPVQEVIQDGVNGFLTDFFDANALADRLADLAERRAQLDDIRIRARQTILDNYDLATICLPAQLRLLESLSNGHKPI